MADPTKPEIDYSYTGFQQEQQDHPFPGSQLDNDLAELKRGIDDTIDALKDVRRADGKLRNGIVTTDSLGFDVAEIGEAMNPSIYDPREVASDVFAMDNMVEGADTKILTASERSSIASALQPSDIGTPAVNAVNRSALAASDTADRDLAVLWESGREGRFTLVNYQDFSSLVDADTAQGIFVRSTSDNTKAWMRVGWQSLNPQWFGAVGYREAKSTFDNRVAVGSATDAYAGLQAALDLCYLLGGGEVWLDRWYLSQTPLVMKYGVSLIGLNKLSAGIVKNSDTAKTVSNDAGTLTGIYPGALPAALNAILILGDMGAVGGRWTGVIRGVTLEGTYANDEDFESWKVEFGIVGIATQSDFIIEDNNIWGVERALILPSHWVARIANNRVTLCMSGFGAAGGTSTNFTNNYAVQCRDYGYYLLALKYSEGSGNACDNLNDPTYYPTRSRLCTAYVFNSMIGGKWTSNGQENTYGRHNSFLSCRSGFAFENNVSINVGSDYEGAEHIAVWYCDGVAQGCRIADNMAYGEHSSGYIHGSANAALHHNVYFVNTSFLADTRFENNVVRASATALATETGWLNNVPATFFNAARGREIIRQFTPTLTCSAPGDLNVSVGAQNYHIQRREGGIVELTGCLHVTVTHTTASGHLLLTGFPSPGTFFGSLNVKGVDNGGTFTDIPKWIRINAGTSTGVFFDAAEATVPITDIPSGTQFWLHYEGRYLVA